MGEDGLAEDRAMEQSNALVALQDEDRHKQHTSPLPPPPATDATSKESLKEQADRIHPVMFSSKHHLSKKQRVRLQAGWVSSLVPTEALSAPAPGSLHSLTVARNLLGPTDDPAGHDHPLLAGASNHCVQWSEPSQAVSLEHVGTTESISIPSHYVGGLVRKAASAVPTRAAGDGTCFEVVCSVSNGPGRFYRTKQVTIAPRFLLVNKLDVPVLMRQYAPKSSSFHQLSSIVCVGAHETQAYHWPHPVRENRPWVCFKREGAGLDGWHWTGFLDLSSSGDSPMLVTHAKSHQSWLAHIDIRMGAHGTACVIIDEFKSQGLVEHLALELPFMLQSRSNAHTIRFRQSRGRPELSTRHGKILGPVPSGISKDLAVVPATPSASASSSATEPSPYDWFEVPPHGVMPFICQ